MRAAAERGQLTVDGLHVSVRIASRGFDIIGGSEVTPVVHRLNEVGHQVSGSARVSSSKS
jgi:hypothetical protein